jgi:1-acyl-sn-glycerol-3-phosphate acyltransferase
MAEDDWGRDATYVRALSPALALAERWWRLSVTGAERVPAEGGVLVVANHAGRVPWDALLVARAIPRDARVVAPDAPFSLPWFGVAARRLGAVPPRAANVERLLEQGHAVLTFVPAQGYRVGRFTLSDVVSRAGAPVVPCAVVGSEEAGTVPWPVRWRIEFGEALDLRTYGHGESTDRAGLLAGADAVQDCIQAMVYDNLVRREGAFL